jgi:hypothetical protein
VPSGAIEAPAIIPLALTAALATGRCHYRSANHTIGGSIMWMIVLTAFLVLFAYLTWRSYKKIEFLTGAIESHDTQQIRLEIMKWNDQNPDKEIKMTWWDKTLADAPTEAAIAHGQPVIMKEIYFMLPLKKRKGQDSLSRDVRTFIEGLCQYVTGKSRWPKE